MSYDVDFSPCAHFQDDFYEICNFPLFFLNLYSSAITNTTTKYLKLTIPQIYIHSSIYPNLIFSISVYIY